MRLCTECNNEFNPSSRHKMCPTCRRKNKKIPCPDCGRYMNHESDSCLPCHNKSGPNSPAWRGGTWKHPEGYIYRYCPGHPRNTGIYVPEHVLVMEEYLGRYLYLGETVHHKNGVKDDNSLTNLELWVSSQPAGQRVTDLVEWAKEILYLYEDYTISTTTRAIPVLTSLVPSES